MQDLVTVIIPIYNEESYLEECLNSLLKQTYENLEIILINDGSSDGSDLICNTFCNKDSRFVLISQENKGLSQARNAGLRAAHGEYICFVDSDDVVEEEYVEVLYTNLVDNQADISMCNYVKAVKNDIKEAVKDNIVTLLDRRQMILDISTTGPNNRSEKLVVSWNKLFKRKIFKDLYFPNILHEDEFMIHQYIVRADKVVWIDRTMYFYRQHNKSIMGKSNCSNLEHLDILTAIEDRIITLKKTEDNSILNAVICSYFENAIIYFHMLLAGNSKWRLMWHIYPPYLKILLRYSNKLHFRQVKHYVGFMISPRHFWHKHWQ